MTTVAGVLVTLVPSMAQAQVASAHANADVRNRSGIQARITFVDTGTELHIVGVATGMRPGVVYETLMYDNGSQPRGKLACLPGQDPSIPSLTGPQMFIGFWEPIGGSTRVLTAVKRVADSSYAALGDVANTSVREFFAQGPPPDNSDLRACGRVRTDR
jgi:hypothetical protein